MKCPCDAIFLWCKCDECNFIDIAKQNQPNLDKWAKKPVRGVGLCHVAERLYRALIKPLRSQILSRIRYCFNYHDLNRVCKVERG